MAKNVIRPKQFSAAFNLSPGRLASLGVFDPALNVDTLLFPDPLLLEKSSHAEMRAAHATFERHFETVLRLIAGSKTPDDAPAKSARARLRFPEIAGTCLGYGANGISGSGAGIGMASRLFDTGQQIIKLGIDDPDLFLAMGLFEKDFGPDLIGDMVTNVVFSHIADLNERIARGLGIPTQSFEVKTPYGTHNRQFIANPVATTETPIILLPSDILRDLPVATDWKGVQEVSAANDEFRSSLNTSVARLWSLKSVEKSKLREWALSSPTAFGDLLDMVHGHDGKPYDFIADPLGEMIWKRIGQEIVSKYPLEIPKPNKRDDPSLIDVVERIIEQYVFLVESRDLWQDLYHNGAPRLEKAVQRIFYAIALAYCDANDIDMTPEAETGRGPVDFKFSRGAAQRVLVEIKLSSNSKVVKGYTGQLEIYNSAEKPIRSYYLVIDVGGMRLKRKALELVKLNATVSGKSIPELRFVDGTPKSSASKV